MSVLANGGFGGGHMAGWGWGAVVLMALMMGGMGWMMWSMVRGTSGHAGDSPEDPVDVLQGRYARGEISTEEFGERRRAIDATRR